MASWDDVDTSFLPFYNQEYCRHPCICSKPKCRELTRLFQSKHDQRGNLYSLPTTREDTVKVNTASVKHHKASLTRLHLHVSEAESSTVDRRNQRKTGDMVTTRASAGVHKQKRRYVACHHFHPKVLLYGCKNKKYSWPDSLPADWVRENIQNNGANDNGYSKNDRFPNDKTKYHAVPSYPCSSAEADYTVLENVATIQATVAEVTTTPATRRTTAGTSSRQSHEGTTRSSRHSTGSTGSASTISTRDSLGSTATGSSGSSTGRATGLLEEGIRYLNDRNKRLESRNNNLESTLNSTANSDPLLDPESVLTGRYGGLNRLSITSDRFHQNNPKLATELFGFLSWKYTKAFMKAVFWLEHEEPTGARLSERLTVFEQSLIALIYLETGYGQVTIASFFGLTTHTQVSLCINLWVPEWGRVGEQLSILPFIDSEFLDKTEPQSYIDLDLRKVGAIVDGKDFYTETVRKDRVVSTAQQGNKLGKSSFRILTWSTPSGLVFEHTKPVFARTTEKKLNALWAKHGRLKIPPGYLISGDKGFEGTSGMYPNHNSVIHPAFLHGDAQFSISKIGWNHRACQLRYTCETVYSRVTNRQTLYGFVRRSQFHLFEDACAWGHGRANLYLPLQMPKDAEGYFAVTTRHKANRKRKRSVEA